MKALLGILLPVLAAQAIHAPIGHLTDLDGTTIVLNHDSDGGLIVVEPDGGVLLPDGGQALEIPESALDGGYCDTQKGVCAVAYCFRQTPITSDTEGVLLPEGWWMSKDRVKKLGGTLTDLQNQVKDKDQQLAAQPGTLSRVGSSISTFLWGFTIGIGLTSGVVVYIMAKKK
jgi:hypothetical protein